MVKQYFSGRQRLIFMAQNTRSAQYYTLVLLFSATTNFFVMTLKLTKKNWTGKKHFGTCRRTRYYEETILLLRSYEIVFRSNAITWLLSLKAITNFRLHQNLFEYLFISFMTLCRGWPCIDCCVEYSAKCLLKCWKQQHFLKIINL